MAMAPRIALLAILACTVLGIQQQHQQNPIRKVVSMLQLMQQRILAEGEKQEEAYKKFMCYCKTNGGELTSTIQAAKDKIEALTGSIKTDSERKVQTTANLKEHTESRDDAKDTMAKATALRKKEAAAFAKEESDYTQNLAALAKAIVAIEKGSSASFLQSSAASLVRKFAMEKADLPDATREELLSFLSGEQNQNYVPQTGEIVGILKTIHDEMTAGLSDATRDENAAIQNYEALMAAKQKEVATLQKQIEEEMTRIGNLAVKIAGEENDLEDTRQTLSADEQFLLDLDASCKTKTQDWELIKKIRSEELLALAETIKVLNDDDALELFKKTLPSASMNLVQVQVSDSALASRALTLVNKARSAAKSGHAAGQPQLDLLALALSGKKQIGFGKVITMIDSMVGNLKNEQVEDDSKKSYCESTLDQTDDKRKALENQITDSTSAIEDMKGSLAELADEIAQLVAGVKALDRAVSDATEMRRAGNADYKQVMSDDATAKEVLRFAKNRLNKFYNPKLYKTPPRRELTAQGRLTVKLGGTVSTPEPGGIANTGIGAVLAQVSMHKVAPPPPPETFGPYTKRTETGNGVIEMIDLLIKDLDKDMQEADVDEKNSQEEYETLMRQSAVKRAADSKSITDKSAEKASTEEALQTEEDTRAGASTEHMNTMKFISSLHAECDWLLKYHEVRKQARSSEIESLMNAKAVLSGASYS